MTLFRLSNKTIKNNDFIELLLKYKTIGKICKFEKLKILLTMNSKIEMGYT